MPPFHDPALSFPASSSLLCGTRLLLHRLEPQHAQTLLVYVQENRDWLAPWEPKHQQSYYTLSGQQQLLKAAQRYWQRGHGLLFGVFERQAPKSTMAGRMCLARSPPKPLPGIGRIFHCPKTQQKRLRHRSPPPALPSRHRSPRTKSFAIGYYAPQPGFSTGCS